MDKNIAYLRRQAMKNLQYKIQIQLNENIFICVQKSLYNTLGHHGVGHFHETGDVCTLHVVDVAVCFSTIFHTLFVDTEHDAV